MVTMLIGDNSFEIERAIRALVSGFSGEVEKYDGAVLTGMQLSDILTSVSLFAAERMVVIRGLSENSAAWPALDKVIDRMDDGVTLVLVDTKPDKRTVTYKKLLSVADVHEFTSWGDRDIAKAMAWVADEAKKQSVKLDNKCVQTLVQWVGMDQWQLFHALEKLALVDTVTEENIKDIVSPNPVENVFNLFETALRGDTKKLGETVKVLEQTEDVYRLTALLSSQVFQLAAIVSATKGDNVAKDFGIHPYVVSKLTAIANKLGKSGVSKIINIFTELDDDMKISRAEPWLLVDRALIKVAAG